MGKVKVWEEYRGVLDNGEAGEMLKAISSRGGAQAFYVRRSAKRGTGSTKIDGKEGSPRATHNSAKAEQRAGKRKPKIHT